MVEGLTMVFIVYLAEVKVPKDCQRNIFPSVGKVTLKNRRGLNGKSTKYT